MASFFIISCFVRFCQEKNGGSPGLQSRVSEAKGAKRKERSARGGAGIYACGKKQKMDPISSRRRAGVEIRAQPKAERNFLGICTSAPSERATFDCVLGP
jgi:hypothetical protein